MKPGPEAVPVGGVADGVGADYSCMGKSRVVLRHLGAERGRNLQPLLIVTTEQGNKALG